MVDVYGIRERMKRLEEGLEGEREDYDRDLNILFIYCIYNINIRGLVHLDILLFSELTI